MNALTSNFDKLTTAKYFFADPGVMGMTIPMLIYSVNVLMLKSIAQSGSLCFNQTNNWCTSVQNFKTTPTNK